MALDRPLVAIDLPRHGHSDGPGDRTDGQLDTHGDAVDVAAAVRLLAPAARAVIGMSLGGLTALALGTQALELVRKIVLVDVLWEALSSTTVPLLLVRGMRPDSVLDDDDERELRSRVPSAQVIHVTEAGDSVQGGDAPLELAAIIERFVFDT